MGDSEEVQILHKLKGSGCLVEVQFWDNGFGSPINVKVTYRGVLLGIGYGETLTESLCDLLPKMARAFAEVLDGGSE